MRNSNDKQRAGSKGGTSGRANTNGGGDRDGRKMAKLGKALGNEEIQDRLAVKNASRDELLTFIQQRLQTVRGLQLDEVALTGRREQRNWWKDVADAHKGIGKPEPTRWKETARLYERAMNELCRGSLGRAKELVEQATREEQSQMNDLTKLVKADSEEREVEEPAMLGSINAGEACAACDVPPEAAKLAKDIQDCPHEVKDPPVKKRNKDPWWTLEEEEEEEDADGST